MNKQQLNALLSKKNEVLSRAQMKKIIGGKVPGEGGPGGNNGNPCPQFCEPVGGHIWCINQVTYEVSSGNCSNLSNYDPNNHNVCINTETGDFWC